MSAFAGMPPFSFTPPDPEAETDGFYVPKTSSAPTPMSRWSSEASSASSLGGCWGVSAASRRPSFLGAPISALVDHMLAASEQGPAAASAASALHPAATAVGRAEFSLAWPPTFPVGGPAEVVELRAAVSVDAPAAGGEGAEGGGGGAAAALAAAAAAHCGTVLSVRDDVVVGEERVKVDASGTARARVRLASDHPCVMSCVLASCEGVPSLDSLHDAAPLVCLPPAAREEAHRLLWRMMHEALPPNHSHLPFDPEAFCSPVDLLPAKLQAALSWAWCHHFRAFAHDFSYLLDCLPGKTEAVTRSPHSPASTAACAATPHPYGGSSDVSGDVSHYQSVLAQMVSFLRDNDMFACLATLLQTAVAKGLALGGMGSPVCRANNSMMSSEVDLDGAMEAACAAAAAADGDGASAALTSALAALHAAAAARDAVDDYAASILDVMTYHVLLRRRPDSTTSGLGVRE